MLTSQSTKPTMQDLFGYERQVTSIAKLKLFSKTICEGAYQTRGTFMGWFRRSIWPHCWEEEVPDILYEPPSTDCTTLVSN